MGHTIIATINKKDINDNSKVIASLTCNANNRAIDYLYLVLNVSKHNLRTNGDCSIHKFNYRDINDAIRRLESLDNNFVHSDIIPFIQKIAEAMKNKVNIFFG